ncbi:adiponectin receptor [Entomortierella parvispora]|uniref:Adiponectin receptor n=1 Tax=Entomortierella parvispora TaxID=205924 RepID=A0A9P3HLX9_9FUNG|nr:adiponectin receptor [Entomortierella parvispora]
MSELKKRTRSSSVRQGVQAAAVKAAAMLPLDLEGIDSAILDKLDTLLYKIESKLRSIEAPSLEKVDSTLRELEEIYATLEMPSIDDKVRATLKIMDTTYKQALQAKSTLRDKLSTAIAILEEKYVELEQTSFERMDDAMGMLEKVDSRAIIDYTIDTIDAPRRAALAGAKRLLRFDELPEQWQENKYILSGYRFLSSKTQCFKSIFYVHNESGNIWTHLLGFFYFLAVGIYFFSGENPYFTTPSPSTNGRHLPFVPADGYDKLVFMVFFLAVYKCLLMSSLWHTFAQIAHEGTMKCMACLDYVGISVLIAASVVVTEYYGFYCEATFRNSYIFATSMFGVAGVVVPWLSWFDQKETRWLRITFFISMAASALLPVFHLALIQGAGPTLEWITPLLKSMGSYLLGVFVYANQYPERLLPGRFDHLGSSHQLWHLCVLGGVYFHFTAALGFWERRYEFGCPSGFEGIAPIGGLVPM